MALPLRSAIVSADTFFAVISISGTSCVQLSLLPGSSPAALYLDIR